MTERLWHNELKVTFRGCLRWKIQAAPLTEEGMYSFSGYFYHCCTFLRWSMMRTVDDRVCDTDAGSINCCDVRVGPVESLAVTPSGSSITGPGGRKHSILLLWPLLASVYCLTEQASPHLPVIERQTCCETQVQCSQSYLLSVAVITWWGFNILDLS